MGHRFAEIAFTPQVRAAQTLEGSRGAYERHESGPMTHDRLGPDEVAFLAERDSFYLASVSETGWPYVQHRGGPPGFLRAVDEQTLIFPDYRGNRQLVSVGNVTGDDRVSLIAVDYPNRARIKLLGHAALVAADELAPHERYTVADPRQIERYWRIRVEAFDWNCPKGITPRFTAAQVERVTAELRERLARAEQRVRELGG
ncbi:MAG: pyridoxamine 5'-phosphate oxidase family protein [Myxococcota bacterium]